MNSSKGGGTAGIHPENPNHIVFARGAHWEELMNRRTTSMVAGVAIAASPAFAAEVTSERLVNADREPQNWLMNHRTYNGQRYSPLARITRENIKTLKLAYTRVNSGAKRRRSWAARP